ncbi:ImmA/IrrE family metallo-endopeptidase [Ferruginibacter sp.]
MGIVHRPEVKMARRLIEKHSLEIPFDLRQLVEIYADVIFKHIPLEGIDGVSMHLKTAGRRPKIIVNTNASDTRQNFTLAHELGHVIIPWHYGTIVDEIEEGKPQFNSPYWNLEHEANRFASEILMPFKWVYALYQHYPDSNYLVSEICDHCGVSEIAAKIRVRNVLNEIEYIVLPDTVVLRAFVECKDLATTQNRLIKLSGFNPWRVADIMVRELKGKIAYCIEEKDKVIVSGGSAEGHPNYQYQGHDFNRTPYKYFKEYSLLSYGDFNTHWWDLDVTVAIPDDTRSWREILDAIVKDVAPGDEQKLKATVNGKVSGSHGSWKKKDKGSVEGFIQDVISRFDDPRYTALLNHPDFLTFVKKRCKSFFNNI